jgi:hypothetical protein
VNNDKFFYILSVILALTVFASAGIILPTLEDKASLTYQVLFFGFTLGAVILFFFAANLIIDGLKRIYILLWVMVKILRNRHKL